MRRHLRPELLGLRKMSVSWLGVISHVSPRDERSPSTTGYLRRVLLGLQKISVSRLGVSHRVSPRDETLEFHHLMGTDPRWCSQKFVQNSRRNAERSGCVVRPKKFLNAGYRWLYVCH